MAHAAQFWPRPTRGYADHMVAETAASNRERVKARLMAGVALMAPLPALALGSALYGSLFLPRHAPAHPVWLWPLLGVAALAGAAGTVLFWRCVRPLTAAGGPRSGSSPPTQAAVPGEHAARAEPAPVPDETESLMNSFSRVLGTIEQQASEIDRYAARLDSAYKEIETSSAQLKEFSFKDEVTGLYNRRFFTI